MIFQRHLPRVESSCASGLKAARYPIESLLRNSLNYYPTARQVGSSRWGCFCGYKYLGTPSFFFSGFELFPEETVPRVGLWSQRVGSFLCHSPRLPFRKTGPRRATRERAPAPSPACLVPSTHAGIKKCCGTQPGLLDTDFRGLPGPLPGPGVLKQPVCPMWWSRGGGSWGWVDGSSGKEVSPRAEGSAPWARPVCVLWGLWLRACGRHRAEPRLSQTPQPYSAPAKASLCRVAPLALQSLRDAPDPSC